MKPSITSKSPMKKRVSPGQKSNFINVVTEAMRKAAGVAFDQLNQGDGMDIETFQHLLSRGDRIAATATDAVKTEMAWITIEWNKAKFANGVKFTRPLSGAKTLELDETDGKATIAKAKDTFPGYIDGDFKGWGCDVKSEPTKKIQVTVHELIKDGRFDQIFPGMSDDLNSLYLTQPQIIQFVQKHKKWLRTDGYGTFFLFKVGEEFFVADVSFGDDGQLKVNVFRLSHDFVWHAVHGHRIVVPQLALAN